MNMFPEMLWINLTMALIGLLFFLFMVVRGVPLRIGLNRMRRRTSLIVDEDTQFSMPAVAKEKPEMITTKDNRTFGKAFRIKSLGGCRIGFAVPNEFVMPEPVLALGVEVANKDVDTPKNYKKMEKCDRVKIKANGILVKISEFTKGLENTTVPVLVKAAMSRAYQEGQIAKERDPIKYGTFIMMVCLGLGFLLMFLKKFGIF